MPTHLERFLAVMEYQPVDRVPNWELGVWPQTVDTWEEEDPETRKLHYQWFPGEVSLGMDPKEFIPFQPNMIPPFDEETLAEDERTITFRDSLGRVRKALKEGHDAWRPHVHGHLHRLPGDGHGELARDQEALRDATAALRGELGRDPSARLARLASTRSFSGRTAPPSASTGTRAI